jgi:hypothetical protein
MTPTVRKSPTSQVIASPLVPVNVTIMFPSTLMKMMRTTQPLSKKSTMTSLTKMSILAPIQQS